MGPGGRRSLVPLNLKGGACSFSIVLAYLLLLKLTVMRAVCQTKEEKPAVGVGAAQPRLLGGRYRVLCWLGGSEDSREGVGVRLPLDLNRVPWHWGGCGDGALWGTRGGRGGTGGGCCRGSCSTTGSGWE
ncbi:hypothetical protein EYF80_018223 [Liparis tanakae]|uniref:Uncharacterized protein n=1 Tax=Liparis tanakae TaxID=230148 RepID=A0A4Z2I0Q7_9TELE|nr:hypothetical protein EYF80_018223 [Liparis tanakae]